MREIVKPGIITMRARRCLIVGLILLTGLAGGAEGCRPKPEPITWVLIRVGGGEDVVQTEAVTVRGLLAERGLELGDLDWIEPGLWTEIYPGLTVTITRVEERQERILIPYSQRILRDESRPPGEKRILTQGQNGEEELVYHVVLEQGMEVRRELVERRLISEPRTEVVIVGIRGMVPPTSLPGLVAYISGGNAWVIDGRSGEKRPLTFEGNLDGRLLSLSSDGTRLLFSCRGGANDSDPLNTLWIVDTRLREESASSLGIEGVPYAAWGPTGNWFVYSTAERTEGAPGWRARNDLWLSSADGVTVTQVLEANQSALYSWWGTSFALSPNGEQMAYAKANEIGVISLPDGERSPLLSFPAYHTYAEWVWLPSMSWSPDSRWLVAVVHVASQETGPVEDSPLFDLYLVNIETGTHRRVVSAVGMWSMPRWSPQPLELADGNFAEIAFLRARRPMTSDESPYDLYVTDRYGSFEMDVFSVGETQELTVPICSWSPLGDQLVVAAKGNLYLIDASGGVPQALTADGLSGQPRWVLSGQ